MSDAPTPPSAPPPSPAPTPAAAPPRRGAALAWLLFIAAALLAGWQWHSAREREQALVTESAQRLDALESRAEGLRRDVRAHGQRLQQADATNRVLRDELLGMGQRAAMLEQQLARLADANAPGNTAMRLDEVELLLVLGEQRLRLAGDLDGARRAYALAGMVLDGVAQPAAINLRQALAQERAALDALGQDPRAQALTRIDAMQARLPTAAEDARAREANTDAPWWERAFGRLVRIRRGDETLPFASEQREDALQAMQLELVLARLAAERRDTAAFRGSLARADAWTRRLWPAGGARDAMLRDLDALRALDLQPAVPTLGSTLALVRAQRGG